MTQKHTIIISDKLKNILKEFDSESLIARLLLSKEQCDFVENPINYISVSEQDVTKISYLSSDRSDKIKKTFIESDDLTMHHLWHSPTRFCARPGSFIAKLFKDISPKEVEKFSNLYRASVNKPEFKLEVVSGSLIKRYYHYSNYVGDGRGTLGNSCMKHDVCQKFLDIYVDNNEIVKMLVMLDENGYLMGRALLWTYESYKIMDRIYTISDEELSFYFKKWASENGFLYKSEQNWSNTMFFESNSNKKQEVQIDIKLKKIDYGYYPYVDTFKWINIETGTIHNYIPKVVNNKVLKTLAASNGDKFDWDYIILDELDKTYCYRNECAFAQYLNIWTHQRNMNFSDINNQWILSKDALYDDQIGDYIFNQDNNHHNNIDDINKRRIYINDRRERQRIEEEKRIANRRRQNILGIVSDSDLNYYENALSQVNGLVIPSFVSQFTRSPRRSAESNENEPQGHHNDSQTEEEHLPPTGDRMLHSSNFASGASHDNDYPIDLDIL
jgi:hypothetical protein